MSLTAQIGAFASIGSLMLSRPATLRRGVQTYLINANRVKANKPYRADQNRKPYDAMIRVDQKSAPIEPSQNDLLQIDSEEWVVWRIQPSPANSHWVLECMAPATVAAIPVDRVRVSDGMGGFVNEWTPVLSGMFHVKTRGASFEGQLTADNEASIQRMGISFSTEDVPEEFNDTWRIEIADQTYEILSISVDDENPFWRNAILVRRGTV